MNNLPQKELLMAVIENGDSVLMRKKPFGSEPYQETWYLFGCERMPTQDDPTTLKNYLKSELGIDAGVETLEAPMFAPEQKVDHDGVEKLFIYLYFRCKYLGGEPKIPKGAEKVEWVPKSEFKNYDLVPPSVKVLKSIGYYL